jgi:microsomal dipeptidase-like Zn-dependent dipeptidase
VWREATPTDHVCVTPQTRAAVADDNRHAVGRWAIPGGQQQSAPPGEGSKPGGTTAGLRGFVDLHTHPLSNLGFGGKLFYGGVDVGSLLPEDPNCHRDARASSMEQALGHDNSTHGGWGAFDNRCGDAIRVKVIHHIQQGTPGAADEPDDSRGASDFKDWPVWNDITHQKMWVDWIRRAYDGGLRVMVALAVNNKTLGDLTAGPHDYPTDDKDSADKQIPEIKSFVGRHADFMEVAYSSADVARIVGANKLAVVLGVEIDNIGNLHTVHPLTNSAISAEIDRLYNEGVRYIFPVHIIDNPFGGTAAYLDLFNYSNYLETGHWWKLGCADSGEQISYQFQSQNNPGAGGVPSAGAGAAGAAAGALLDYAPLALLSTLKPNWGGLLLDAVVLAKLGRTLPQPPKYPNCGQKNTAPLTPQGQFALKEMMRHGMLIDLDHMSEATFNMALAVAEGVPGGYPLNSGHSSLRGDGGNERTVTANQYERIGKLHGMAGIGSANTDACNWTISAWKALQAMQVSGNSGGIGFGTDTNGLAMGMPTSTSKDTPAAGDPAAMMGDKQQHLFYRDVYSHIAHAYWDSGSSQFKGEIWGGPPAAGDPAAMMGDNQQHLFYRDTQNRIVHVYYDQGSNKLHGAEYWGGPGSPHNAPPAVGDPAVMMGDNQQHLFYRDTQNRIVHVYYDHGKKQLSAPEIWAGPGSPHNAPAAAGDPAVMMGDNQQHLFYRDTQNRIVHVYYDKQLKGPEYWGGPGTHSATAAAGDPAVMMGSNQQHLFYRDSGHNIVHVYYDQGKKQLSAPEFWGGMRGPHNPVQEAPSATGDPAVMMGDNQQHLFYRDSENRILHVYYDEGKKKLNGPEIWAGAESMSNPPAPAEVGRPAVMMGDKQQHLFYLSPSGAIWHVLYDGKQGLRSERWAPAKDGASAQLDGPNMACAEYHAPIAYGRGFSESSLGTHTWNYNTDGVAHYGMIADFLRAVRTMPQHGQLPGGAKLIDDYLEHGAEYFFETWQKAEQQSTKVR